MTKPSVRDVGFSFEGRGPFATVVFSPTRTQVEGVSIDVGEPEPRRFDSHSSGWRKAWTADLRGIDVEKATLHVEYRGEEPRGLCAIRDDRASGTVLKYEKDVANILRCLLESRASIAKGDEALTFILRLDAWTNMKVVDYIDECGSGLSPWTRDLFCNRPMFSRDGLVRMDQLGAGLVEQAIDLVNARWNHAQPPSFKFPITAMLVAESAGYWLQIMRTLSHCSEEQLLSKLEAIFCKFAVGEMAIRDKSKAASATGGELERKELLNAEPDSALFFAFCECALRMANSICLTEDAHLWLGIARLFAVLEEGFIANYAPPVCVRRLSSYGPDDVDPRQGRRVTSADLAERLEHYRKRLIDIDAIRGRHEAHFLWAVYDQAMGHI